jgi:hypothetical protein
MIKKSFSIYLPGMSCAQYVSQTDIDSCTAAARDVASVLANYQQAGIYWSQYYNNQYNPWKVRHDAFQSAWNLGRTTNGSYIWDSNDNLVNCNNVSTCTITIAGVTYTQNCNDAGNTCNRCTTCGFNKCTCTAGIGNCHGNCSEFRTSSDKSRFQDPVSGQWYNGVTWAAAEQDWLNRDPQPVPSFNTNLYPDPKITGFPNVQSITCQSCKQCLSIGNITSDSTTINGLQQNCISQLQQKAATQSTTSEYTSTNNTSSYYPPTATQATSTSVDNKKTMIIILAVSFLVLLIVIGIILAVSSSGKRRPMYPMFGPPMLGMPPFHY